MVEGRRPTCCVLGGKNSREKYVPSSGKAAILSTIFSMTKVVVWVGRDADGMCLLYEDGDGDEDEDKDYSTICKPTFCAYTKSTVMYEN